MINAPDDVGGVITGLQLVVLTVQMIHQQLAGDGHIVVLLRPGSFPVGTGQVLDLTGLVVVPVGVGDLVGDGVAGLGDGESSLGDEVLGDVLHVDSVIIAAHQLGGIHALSDHDGVQSLVCAVAGCEVVGTGIQDVGTGGAVSILVGHVVGSDILHIDLDIDNLGIAGLQHAGLLEVQQLDSRLLHAALIVGSLAVDLHGSLTGHIAGVGDGDREGHVDVGGAVFSNFLLPNGGAHLEVEGGVAQTPAEAVGDFVSVAPGAVGSVGTGGGGSVVDACDCIVVTGLVVTVADVDAFSLDGVSTGGEAHDAAGTGNFVSVCVVQTAEVLHCGCRHVVSGEDVKQATGGADLAGQNVSDAQVAVVTDSTDPQDGIDLGVVLQGTDLNGGRGSDQDDDLVGSFLSQVDSIHFVLSQRQRLAMLEAQTLSNTLRHEVNRLTGATTNNNDSCIAVLSEAVLVGAVDACDLIQRGFTRIVILFCSAFVFNVLVNVGVQVFIDLDHGGVQIEARTVELELLTVPAGDGGTTFAVSGAGGGADGVGEISLVATQSLLQRNVDTLCLDAEAGAQEVRVGTDTQQGNIGTFAQRQNIVVVLQQNGAFSSLTAAQIDSSLDQSGGITGAVLIQVLGVGDVLGVQFFGILRNRLGTGGTQESVDGAGIGFQDRTQDHGEGQDDAQNARQTTPQCSFLVRHFLNLLLRKFYTGPAEAPLPRLPAEFPLSAQAAALSPRMILMYPRWVHFPIMVVQQIL